MATFSQSMIPRGFRKSYIPTWDDECVGILNERHEATDQDCRQKVAAALFDHLNENQHEHRIEAVSNINFTHSSRRAWNSINRLTGKSSTKRNCPISLNIIAKQPVENGMYPVSNKTLKREVLQESSNLRSRNTLPEHEHLNMNFSVQEVHSAIRRLKLGKAPGPDGIHNEFLMQSGIAMMSWLTSFCNACYQNNRIPRMWHRANIIGLLKPGENETSPQSYRPIFLLCSTYKLMERLLLYRISPIINPLLSNDQASFRQARSTVDQVVRLTQSIKQSCHDKEVTGVVFLDLTATYDTVWHQGMRLKLQRMISSTHVTDFIMELLYSRSFVLHTSDRQTSKPHRLKNGVAQGSVLAPILYNIYTSDFPTTLGTRYMYADDVALKASAHTTSEIERSLSVGHANSIMISEKNGDSNYLKSVFHLPSEGLHGRLSTSS